MISIWMLWVKSDDGLSLESAWDNDTIEENYEGWEREQQRVAEMCAEEGWEFRLTYTNIDLVAVQDTFEAPQLRNDGLKKRDAT